MNKIISKITPKNTAIILLIAIFFVSDRILKNLALATADLQPIKLVGNILWFNFTKNSNIAFSLPLSGLILTILITIAILALVCTIIYLILNKKANNLSIVLLTFILFGAISNILDRIIYGYVIDYLELSYFAVFNIADAMISLGAIIMIFKINWKK